MSGNVSPAGSATVVNRVTTAPPGSPFTCVRFSWLATVGNAPPLYVLAKRYDMDGNMYKRLWWATSYPGTPRAARSVRSRRTLRQKM